MAEVKKGFTLISSFPTTMEVVIVGDDKHIECSISGASIDVIKGLSAATAQVIIDTAKRMAEEKEITFDEAKDRMIEQVAKETSAAMLKAELKERLGDTDLHELLTGLKEHLDEMLGGGEDDD